MLPRVKLKSTERDTNMRARWRQIFTEGHASTREEGLDVFRKYFERVAASKFLTGQAPRAPGHANWQCDLGWLMKASNFVKVVERGYA